jgi:hypothetical protein
MVSENQVQILNGMVLLCILYIIKYNNFILCRLETYYVIDLLVGIKYAAVRDKITYYFVQKMNIKI